MFTHCVSHIVGNKVGMITRTVARIIHYGRGIKLIFTDGHISIMAALKGPD